jgi:hypothetical protein
MLSFLSIRPYSFDVRWFSEPRRASLNKQIPQIRRSSLILDFHSSAANNELDDRMDPRHPEQRSVCHRDRDRFG